jgi:sugar phosphate permease
MRFPPLRLALAVWGLAASFYLFGFFQRVMPASLADLLMRDFALSAVALGNLSALYYYTYAAVQLPTGILVHRLGPTRLLLAGSTLAGVGALLFALGSSMLVAGAGRALIGAAHGMAWVSMLTLVAHWFPARRFGTMSGISLMVGSLGALMAGPPLRQLADAFGWRPTVAATGALALLLALAIWWQIRDDPRERGYASHAPAQDAHAHDPPLLAALRQVLANRNVWLIAAVNSGVCGSFLAFTGLWGVPFFVQQHGLAPKGASAITTSMLLLFTVSAPLFGLLSDRLHRHKLPFAIGGGLMVAGFGVLALAPAAPLGLLVPALLVGSIGAGSMVLSFAFAKASVPRHLQGAATGLTNLGVMAGALVQMPVLGLILDAHWDGRSEGGVRLYGLAAFQAGLLFLAAWIAAAFVLLLLTRERPHAAAARDVTGQGRASAT